MIHIQHFKKEENLNPAEKPFIWKEKFNQKVGHISQTISSSSVNLWTKIFYNEGWGMGEVWRAMIILFNTKKTVVAWYCDNLIPSLLPYPKASVFVCLLPAYHLFMFYKICYNFQSHISKIPSDLKRKGTHRSIFR